MENKCDWIVQLTSTPGMYAQYEGEVKVWADSNADDDTLFRAAVKKLSNGAFYDRKSLDFWKLISVRKGQK
ncbi:hypothetical protein [Acinetobacter bereziniae]|uniref:hypothetical protein n=1 Tax=Acinetobacter bereziniae TaxID=106648 RepID=UPI000C2BEE2D|nr:hypothetical protein [Acinetobacter bereziniae]ATZ62917.1 hypothetical protein BSR55_05975 [Acinetobacter bereziniae]